MGVNSLHWYYRSSIGNVGEIVVLEGDEWHHCYHVLRLKTGDSIVLTDGRGSCMEGLIRSANQREGNLELTYNHQDEFRSPRRYKLSIGLAPTKNIDRTEFAIEKLVELGVDEISFLSCKHAERHHIRMDRFEKIVISAAKQSRKIYFPTLLDLITPANYISQKRNEDPAVSLLCGHLDTTSKPLHENYSPGSNVVILIGPEGGFASEELEIMTGLNVKMVHLGPYRLRVETAAITACAGIHLLNQLNTQP